jgi:hypothetical protein
VPTIRREENVLSALVNKSTGSAPQLTKKLFNR